MAPIPLTRLAERGPLMRFSIFLLFVLLFCDDAQSVLHELGL